MSSGSVPGSSGENMIYYLITGVAAFGALFYVSRGAVCAFGADVDQSVFRVLKTWSKNKIC